MIRELVSGGVDSRLTVIHPILGIARECADNNMSVTNYVVCHDMDKGLSVARYNTLSMKINERSPIFAVSH